MGIEAHLISKELDTLDIKSTKIWQEVQIIEEILKQIDEVPIIDSFIDFRLNLKKIHNKIKKDTKKTMLRKGINKCIAGIYPVGITFTSAGVLLYIEIKNSNLARYGGYFVLIGIASYLIYLPFVVGKSISESLAAKYEIENKVAPSDEIKYINHVIKRIKQIKNGGKYEKH